jgi:hypothetical protein
MADDQQSLDLQVELTAAVLAQKAPDELVLLEETSAEFFDDPEAALSPAREESVGFGVEIVFLTPFILAIARPVVDFLLELAAEATQDAVKPSAVAWVRKLFRLEQDQAGPAAALTADQLRTVRQIAYSKAQALGLEEGRAAELADAIAGGTLAAA